uniref:Uncharacterized protein n=1 Tax=Oryza rufipogon TaxID=4529 RepID=A0A0E0NXM0_ORYRU
MAWTWRPEDLFLETLKDSLARQRAWRHRGIAWRWPGVRGQSGRADYTAGTQHCLGAFEGIGSEIFTPGKYSNMLVVLRVAKGGDGGGAAAEAEEAEEAHPADYTAGTQHCLGAFEGIGSEIFTPGKYSNMVN